jgi:tRNA threonylcarbamoyladenosine biosynthesis protein TsaB
MILNLETTTKNCSVSLADQGNIVAIKELKSLQYSHGEKLHLFISEVLQEAGVTPSQLKAIAVSKGPGSYTGLRIGVSAAKGLCFALNKPLIAINTLSCLSHAISTDKGFIVPMIDARRMEVYSAIFDANYQRVRATEAQVIDENSFQNYLAEAPVYFLGDAVEKCKEIITHKNAFFIEDRFPSAKEMGVVSYEKFKKKQFEDIAYFEPFYLKDFVAVPEKKK